MENSMQVQSQNDKMVPIDTSGDPVEVEVKEEDKLNNTESEVNVEQVDQDISVQTDEKKEELEDYSVALSKLYKWLRLAIQVRIADVKMRRNEKKRLEEERNKAIELEKQRQEKRQAGHDEEAQKFKEQQEAQKA